MPLRCCSLVLLVGAQAAAQEAHLVPALEAPQVAHLAANLAVVLAAHLLVVLVAAHLAAARVSHLAAVQVVAQVASGRKLELLVQRVHPLEQPLVEQMDHTLPAFQVPNP